MLTDGADSLVYRLMFHGLRQAYEPASDALAEVMRNEVDAVATYRHLAAAVGARDTELARRTAQHLQQPSTDAFYRAVWRNHRLHHYKNEHYWFTVTTTATADRVLGTYPDPMTVQRSPTARSLPLGPRSPLSGG